MLDSPVVANLHDVEHDKWHPIVFRLAPTPSGMERYKSVGHHTEGFDTREGAIECCKKMYEDMSSDGTFIGKKPRLCIQKDFPWDGQGVPAMVVFFGEVDGETVPLF